MTAVDFLPPAYRARLARRRVARERLLLAIPIVLALVATDLVLRWRVQNVRRMAQLASEHAQSGQVRGDVARDLTRDIRALEASLTADALPLDASRMTSWLDALLLARPDGVTFHEVGCRHRPWSADRTPSITVQASAATQAAFAGYLATLRGNPELPPLTCNRTFHGGASNELGFELETKAANAPPGAPR